MIRYTARMWIMAVAALAVFGGAVAPAQAQLLFSLGPTWQVSIPVPDYYDYPDGHITLLPDGNTNQMYWAEFDSYRTFGRAVETQSSADPTTPLLAPGAFGQPDHNGCWLMSVIRQSDNNLIGFYHMEDHVFNGVDASPVSWNSVGAAKSTDDGATWTKLGMILGKPSFIPTTPTWGGIGNQCTIWDGANSRFITYYPCVTHNGDTGTGITAAVSSTGAPGTWEQYDNGMFNSPGIDGDDTPLPGLSNASGGNPSVTWNTYLHEWLMVWHDWTNDTFYMSTSADLINWTQQQTLLAATGYSISYPTIIGATDVLSGASDSLYYSAWPSGTRKFIGQSITFYGGLSAVAGDGQVDLSWTTTPGATSYTVYRGTAPGAESPTPVATGVLATGYVDTACSNGTTYYYKVASVNADGTVVTSVEASATPMAPPAAPTGLIAKGGNEQVALTWTASGSASTYILYRGTASAGESPTPIATVSTLSFTNTGLTNGKTYYYVVKAADVYGKSKNSNQASATPELARPLPPTNLTAVGASGDVALHWLASVSATSYNIYRGAVSGGESTVPKASVDSTSFTNTGLSDGKTYYYVVKAVNAVGTSTNSNQASAMP